ncbi:trichothecene c-15 hydroxylase protein [Penicillium mononematosum]|uniref:trichothecene c-15 hydroxylase protein n=1 Tax=Penicillium mononematosum TaxID=268346 RepID=UPI0025476C8D|nr:trichothecene c-15 hydroxylase protein [Penicillium mononematosum]KAJ6180976.1 trichothecene c-15 hydroxylase protein [Penicillium mononematosum]
MHVKMLELHRRYGPVIRVEPNKLVYHHAEAVSHIWNRRRPQDSRPALINALNPNNLLCGPPDKHTRYRRALLPGFSKQAKLARGGIIQKYAGLLVARLKEHSTPIHPFNITTWIHKAQGDMVSELTYGENIGCLQSDSESPLLAALLDWDVLTAYGVAILSFLPTKLLSLMVSLTPSGLEGGMLSELTRLSKERTLERMDSAPTEYTDFVSSIWKDEEFDKNDADPRDDSLSVSAARSTPLTIEEIHSNIKIFTVGALGTMTHLLAATIFYLATNPESMTRLASEIRTAFAAEDDIDLDGAMTLPYLNAVIHESMRMRPPTPMLFPREIAAGGDLVLDKFIPEGTVVEAWFAALYRDEKHFVDANSFIPERWLDGDDKNERFANDRRDVFMPFGTGPRVCPGKVLANSAIRFFIARLVWAFNFRIADQSRDWYQKSKPRVLWSQPDLYVHLIPRAEGNERLPAGKPWAT